MKESGQARRLVHRGAVVWLTGLSGAGKTTIAQGVVTTLEEHGYVSALIDGDILRTGLCRDLGFSKADRDENVRRAGELARAMADAGVICVAALISPYREGRDALRALMGSRFHEVYVSTPLSECERRDPKGLYSRARSGGIQQYTGISAPYEPPLNPDLTIDTTGEAIAVSVGQLVDYLLPRVR